MTQSHVPEWVIRSHERHAVLAVGTHRRREASQRCTDSHPNTYNVQAHAAKYTCSKQHRALDGTCFGQITDICRMPDHHLAGLCTYSERHTRSACEPQVYTVTRQPRTLMSPCTTATPSALCKYDTALHTTRVTSLTRRARAHLITSNAILATTRCETDCNRHAAAQQERHDTPHNTNIKHTQFMPQRRQPKLAVQMHLTPCWHRTMCHATHDSMHDEKHNTY
jgi:hypothetical protein